MSRMLVPGVAFQQCTVADKSLVGVFEEHCLLGVEIESVLVSPDCRDTIEQGRC